MYLYKMAQAPQAAQGPSHANPLSAELKLITSHWEIYSMDSNSLYSLLK
jgi:hypothetical protein